MNRFRLFVRRLVRWCFGAAEMYPPDKPSEPPATVPFITPDALRRQIATATGIPLENIRIVPMKLVECDCPKCRLRRQLANRYTPSNN